MHHIREIFLTDTYIVNKYALCEAGNTFCCGSLYVMYEDVCHIFFVYFLLVKSNPDRVLDFRHRCRQSS